MSFNSREPAPRRRRAARWLLPAALLLALLAVADQVARYYAERAVAHRLAGRAPFSGTPRVDVHGFPFLTQALSGRYGDVAITGGAPSAGGLAATGFDATLVGVHVPIAALLGGSLSTVRVDEVTGTALISYPQFARLTGVPGLTITAGSGRLTVAAPVAVPLLNRNVDVVADGRVGLAGRQLELTVSNVRVAGVSLPQSVVRVASDVLNSQVRVPALPDGLQLTGVVAAADGLQLSAAGQNVVIALR